MQLILLAADLVSGLKRIIPNSLVDGRREKDKTKLGMLPLALVILLLAMLLKWAQS